jgi:hypothetical protein
MDPEKESKRYSDQLGAKKESNDELAKSIKVILGDHKKKPFGYRQKNEHVQIILGAMLFKDSQ